MDDATRRQIEANLFPPARGVIDDWESFPWHRGRDGSYQVAKPHSSQALAIDVFGAIIASPHRDSVMAQIAESLGVPATGPWSLTLEWDDGRVNRLREPRPTQVDVVAEGRESLVFFECKFTEKDGGGCSQTQALGEGAHKGLKQCTGSYTVQSNPVTGRRGRCALTGKGIRYWEIIPKVFLIESDRDYLPCPFAGSWFHWMRNAILCHEVAKSRGLHPTFAVVFAAGDGLPLAEKARTGGWSRFQDALRPGALTFGTVSFQSIVQSAREAVESQGQPDPMWQALEGWVAGKVSAALAR